MGLVNEAAPGKIVILNGASSAGKTTLARALQANLGEPFCFYASDQLADSGFRSRSPAQHPPTERDRFFNGFHRSIAAFASAGNNLIVEHIVEEQQWAEDLRTLLTPFHVLWVGVHAPPEELSRRERERSDRASGEALFHLKTHGYCRYHVEVDSTLSLPDQVQQVQTAWYQHLLRRSPASLSSGALQPPSARIPDGQPTGPPPPPDTPASTPPPPPPPKPPSAASTPATPATPSKPQTTT